MLLKNISNIFDKSRSYFDGDFVLVKNAVIIEQALEAWNLTVADTHTFFVHGSSAAANDNMPLDGVLQNISLTPPHLDKNAVWVHNCNKPKKPGKPGKRPKCDKHLKQVKEHQDKLNQFSSNPQSMDNKGQLHNLTSDNPNREYRIDGRKKKLLHAVDRHRREYLKCMRGQ